MISYITGWLTEELAVLSRELNFASAPPRFQQLIVAAVESGLRRALDKLAEPARTKVVGDISKAPVNYLTQERKAIKNLKQDECLSGCTVAVRHGWNCTLVEKLN